MGHRPFSSGIFLLCSRFPNETPCPIHHGFIVMSGSTQISPTSHTSFQDGPKRPSSSHPLIVIGPRSIRCYCVSLDLRFHGTGPIQSDAITCRSSAGAATGSGTDRGCMASRSAHACGLLPTGRVAASSRYRGSCRSRTPSSRSRYRHCCRRRCPSARSCWQSAR